MCSHNSNVECGHNVRGYMRTYFSADITDYQSNPKLFCNKVILTVIQKSNHQIHGITSSKLHRILKCFNI